MVVATESDLTPEEVAERLRVDVTTVRRWLADGDLRGYKLPGGKLWRIPAEEVERIKRGDTPAD